MMRGIDGFIAVGGLLFEISLALVLLKNSLEFPSSCLSFVVSMLCVVFV